MSTDRHTLFDALAVAAIAEGESRLTVTADEEAQAGALMEALQRVGVGIERRGDVLHVRGCGLDGFHAPADALSVGDSFDTFAALLGVLAGRPFGATITATGDLARRAMHRYIEPLREMGCNVAASDRGTMPVRCNASNAVGTSHTFPFPNAALRGMLMIAAQHAQGTTTIDVPAGARDDLDYLLALKRHATPESPDALLCASDQAKRFRDAQSVTIIGGMHVPPIALRIPSDPVSALYNAVVAACSPEGEALLRDVALNPSRSFGLALLKEMGAHMTVERYDANGGAPCGDVRVRGAALRVTAIDAALVPRLHDELPALALAAACAEGTLTIHGAMNMRQMACDRVAAIVENLYRMGIETDELDDGFIVHGAPGALREGDIEDFGDSAIAAMCDAARAIAARLTPQSA